MKISKYDFQELLHILEEAEDEKVTINPSFLKESTFNIISKQNKGEPNIVFRFSDDTLVLSNVFLKNKGIGTGKRLVSWLINYARIKELTFFKISFVKPSNIALRKIATTYNMEIKQDGERFDYILNLKM